MYLISSTQLLIALVVAGGCIFLGTKLFDWDSSVERHRKAAGIIAGVLDRYGLSQFASLFRDYSVGDYSGLEEGLVDLASDLEGGEAAIVAELDEVFERVLEVKLLDPVSRAYLAARLEATKTKASESPANSPISPAPEVKVAA